MPKVFSCLLVALLVLLALPALAQTYPPPEIHSISPRTGQVTGGTLVTITGRFFDLPPNFACVVPCPPVVRFGTAEVTSQSHTDSAIAVIAPAHVAGVVDVTVRTGDNRTVTAPAAFTFGPDAGWEAALVPIYTDGRVPGAEGSQWQTDLWIRNHSTEALTVAPWPCPPSPPCPPVFPSLRMLAPGETVHNLPALFRPPGNPSRMIHFLRPANASVSINVRVADVSRAELNSGTEIPVVREARFLTSPASLQNIPLSQRFRVAIRVYEMQQQEARFRVRFYPQSEGSGGTAIQDIELTASTAESGPFRTQAAYVEYAGLGSLLNQPTIQPPALRAEIEPLTPGSRYWALAAITNNETQLVTLVTPQ